MESLNIMQKIEPILKILREIMGPRTPHIRTHNVMFAPVGSEAQTWHYDDSVRRSNVYRYFTILVPLNPIDDDCGGTEIWSDSLKRSDMVRTSLLRNINSFGNDFVCADSAETWRRICVQWRTAASWTG